MRKVSGVAIGVVGFWLLACSGSTSTPPPIPEIVATPTTVTTGTTGMPSVITAPDGSTVTTTPDGTITTLAKDGTVTMVSPDGTTTVTKPDGSVTTTSPTGTVTTSSAAGTTTTAATGTATTGTTTTGTTTTGTTTTGTTTTTSTTPGDAVSAGKARYPNCTVEAGTPGTQYQRIVVHGTNPKGERVVVRLAYEMLNGQWVCNEERSSVDGTDSADLNACGRALHMCTR
jgi:hypothetical protein